MKIQVRRSLIALIVLAAVESAAAVAQSTQLASIGSTGNQGNADSYAASLSADGRYVVFLSSASNLVPGDNNGVDVFVRDRLAATTVRASLNSLGIEANGESMDPSISGNGSRVAFGSSATNLAAGDLNGTIDIFLRDLSQATTVRLSCALGGGDANDTSRNPDISTDGRFVAFESYANNLVVGDTNGVRDIFVAHVQLGTVVRASVNDAGVEANGNCENPSISADGRFVAFQSDASNLVGGDLNGSADVFVRDMVAGLTRLVSVGPLGVQANAACVNPMISGNGRSVVFQSIATSLVAGDTNGRIDIFVHNTVTGITTLESLSSSGSQSTDHCQYPTISSTGRYVTFEGDPTNFGMPSSNNDVYVRDRQLGVTVPANYAIGGYPNDGCFSISISENGRIVCFVTRASNIALDSNGFVDVFARDWPSAFRDADSDLYGSMSDFTAGPLPSGYVGTDGDCDDSNPAVSPGSPEVPCNGLDDNCDGVVDENMVISYCTAGTSVHGCVPWIQGLGLPSATSVSGFNIVVSNVPGQRYGTIFYGFYPANVPWAPNSPSYRCVSFPIQRMGNLPTHGSTNQCNGDLTIDFNAWYAANPGALAAPFVPGQVFYAQGWYRDPAAPKQTNLSNGLRFTLCN